MLCVQCFLLAALCSLLFGFGWCGDRLSVSSVALLASVSSLLLDCWVVYLLGLFAAGFDLVVLGYLLIDYCLCWLFVCVGCGSWISGGCFLGWCCLFGIMVLLIVL